jgi:hypothetical protein
VEAILKRLRDAGWMVAVHNDYRLNGQFHTFWLFTHASGVWAKGEGLSDEDALKAVELETNTRRVSHRP